MIKKAAFLLVTVMLVAVMATGCMTTSTTMYTVPSTQAPTNGGGEAPDDHGGGEVPDDSSTAESETSDGGVAPPQKITGFGDLPSAYVYYKGGMSSPKSYLTLSSDGSFHVKWTQLKPQSETDSDTGFDLSTMEMNGTLASLAKSSEDYCYTCRVVSSDSNDYPVGQTVTFLLPGAPVSALPEKNYPSVLTGHKDGKLTVTHMYFELQNSVYLAGQ